jgi:DNA-binding MarR family transcriptional regulator
MALTQQGIAEATGIRVNHVSRAMKGLKSEGLVTESSARVRGQVRRRKVYSLSPAGVTLANGIREDILKRTVVLGEESGRPREMTVAEAQKEAKGRTLLELAVAVDDLGVVSLRKKTGGAAEAQPRALVLEGMTAPESFYDRKEELDDLRAWYEDAGMPVMILRGRAGVGKTSLAAVFAREASESGSVLWHDVGEWDTPDALLGALASMLAQLGKESLKSALSGSRKMVTVDLLRILRRDMRGVAGLCVFDGCDGCSEDVARFVEAVLEAAITEPSLQVLLATDTGDVPMSRELAASGHSQVMNLTGLDKDSCRKLIGEDVDDAEFEKLYGLTRGHPLSFRLLATKEMEDLVRGKELTPEEAALVKYLALTENP